MRIIVQSNTTFLLSSCCIFLFSILQSSTSYTLLSTTRISSLQQRQQQQHQQSTKTRKSFTLFDKISPNIESINNFSNLQKNEKIPKEQHQQQQRRKRICIVGGGFGGLNTALTLDSLLNESIDDDDDDWNNDGKPEIILIDPKERFVFLPLLYELCRGEAELEEVAPTYRSLFAKTDIKHVIGEVKGIDSPNNILHFSSSGNSAKKGKEDTETLKYDMLVIATGCSEPALTSMPNVSKYALPFYTVEDCFKVKKELELIKSYKKNEAEVVVVGGGYAGVELALNIMEDLGGVESSATVVLVHRGENILGGADEYTRSTSMDQLKRAGVKVMTSTSVTGATSFNSKNDPIPGATMTGEDAITMEQKKCNVLLGSTLSSSSEGTGEEKIEQSLSADLFLWTAGASRQNIQEGALNSILPRDTKGRILTGNTLQVCDHPDVYVLGDLCRTIASGNKPSSILPATASVAMQQAPVVAWNIYATLNSQREGKIKRTDNNDELLPFDYVDLGNMMSLGSDEAVIVAGSGLGEKINRGEKKSQSKSSSLVKLNGLNASLLRRVVYAVRMPTPQQALIAARLGIGRKVVSLLQKDS